MGYRVGYFNVGFLLKFRNEEPWKRRKITYQYHLIVGNQVNFVKLWKGSGSSSSRSAIFSAEGIRFLGAIPTSSLVVSVRLLKLRKAHLRKSKVSASCVSLGPLFIPIDRMMCSVELLCLKLLCQVVTSTLSRLGKSFTFWPLDTTEVVIIPAADSLSSVVWRLHPIGDRPWL